MRSPGPDRLEQFGGKDGLTYGLSEWEYRVGQGECKDQHRARNVCMLI